MKAVVTVTGAPLTPEPAAEKGFKIERLNYTLDGEPVDATKVKQNTRFAVVLKITEAQPQFGRVIVADYLPAGFEIDNPHLVSSGDTGTLSWITDARGAGRIRVPRRPLHRGVRAQERAIRRCSRSPTWCARSSPGKYVRPQASVEDMYRPDRFGRTDTEHRRGHGGEMSSLARRLTVRGWRGEQAARDPRVARSRGACFARPLRGRIASLSRSLAVHASLAAGWWIASLGPAPLGEDLEFSTPVVDRDGRLLRAYATREGRWRLPATVADVDPRFFDVLFAYEDKRFRAHHGVDPLALDARRVPTRDAAAASSPAARR